MWKRAIGLIVVGLLTAAVALGGFGTALAQPQIPAGPEAVQPCDDAMHGAMMGSQGMGGMMSGGGMHGAMMGGTAQPGMMDHAAMHKMMMGGQGMGGMMPHSDEMHGSMMSGSTDMAACDQVHGIPGSEADR